MYIYIYMYIYVHMYIHTHDVTGIVANVRGTIPKWL